MAAPAGLIFLVTKVFPNNWFLISMCFIALVLLPAIYVATNEKQVPIPTSSGNKRKSDSNTAPPPKKRRITRIRRPIRLPEHVKIKRNPDGSLTRKSDTEIRGWMARAKREFPYMFRRVTKRERHPMFWQAFINVFEMVDITNPESIAVQLGKILGNGYIDKSENQAQKKVIFELLMRQPLGLKFLKKHGERIRGEMETKVQNNAFSALVCFVMVGLNFSQYSKLVKYSFKEWDPEKQEWCHPHIDGLDRFPDLFPSVETLRKLYNEETTDNGKRFEVKRMIDTKGVLRTCTTWDVRKILAFIWNNTMMRDLFKGDDKKLVLIIKGDGFPLGNTGGFILSATLLNFGEYCKCPILNFPVCVTDISESDPVALKKLLQPQLDVINKIIRDGKVQLPDGPELPCEVVVGGDLKMHQTMLNLGSCSSTYLCHMCYHMRNTPKQKTEICKGCTHVERMEPETPSDAHVINMPTDHVAIDIDSSHQHDHTNAAMDTTGIVRSTAFGKFLIELNGGKDAYNHKASGEPWFPELENDRFVFCLLHCLIAFGKTVGVFLGSRMHHLIYVEKNESKKRILSRLQNVHIMLNELRIDVDTDWKDPKGFRNMKGNTAKALLSRWTEIAQWLDIPDEDMLAVEEMGKVFDKLFQFRLSQQEVEELCNTVPAKVRRFLEALRPNERNYFHMMEVELPGLLKKYGSLWPYCNDVQESLNWIAKDCFLHYTTRGGLNGEHWTLTFAKRQLAKSLVCVQHYGLHSFPALKYEMHKVRKMSQPKKKKDGKKKKQKEYEF